MSKAQAGRRKQPEFLFVFDSKDAGDNSSTPAEETIGKAGTRRSRISNEESESARRKLLAELRELGC